MNFFHKIIKTIITLIFYFVDTLTFLLSKRVKDKKIINKTLLVNLGALGDNFIFLNAIIQINSKYSISQLVDTNTKIIFNQQQNFDFFHVDRKKYIRNVLYRIKTNLFFSNYHFDKVVNVRGSRNGIYEDSIIRFISGKKYALITDYDSNSLISLKLFDYFNYNHLVKFDLNKNIHEIKRINILFNEVFQSKLSLKLIDLTYYFKKILHEKLITGNYFVLNIGAGKNFRKWDINKFIKVGNIIEKDFNLIPVYCGLEQDNTRIKNAELSISKKSVNLCGKTSIPELINVIKFSSFNISNDSADAHISILLKKNTLSIKSKFQQNRFLPYPMDLSNENIKVLTSSKIDDISVDDVCKLIDFKRN